MFLSLLAATAEAWPAWPASRSPKRMMEMFSLSLTHSLSGSLALAGKQGLPALHTLPSCSRFVPHYCAARGGCAAATSAAAAAAVVVAPRENACSLGN